MIPSAITACLLAAAFAPRALAQCPGWTDPLELAGIHGSVVTSAVFDDGSGPALILGGVFDGPTSRSIPYLARWNGSTWSDLGGATNGIVWSLITADDGTGPKLFAGGNFTTIGGANVASVAKWDGTTWSPIGTNPIDAVRTLFSTQSAAGWRLYAVTTIGGPSTMHPALVVFDGSSWSTIADGPSVYAMSTFDWGSGPELVVGGEFSTIQGVAAHNIARWNGSSWSAIGAGTSGRVFALEPFDDGSGPSLFVGGDMGSGATSGPYLARFDGSNFNLIPGTAGFGSVLDFGVHDDGSGPALYVASSPYPYSNEIVHRWDGSSFTPLGTSVPLPPATGASALTLASYDDGNGSALAVGGSFSDQGGVESPSIIAWRGGGWEPIGHEQGVRGEVRAIAKHDDGSGEAVYVAGDFHHAGGRACANIARFDGTTFEPLAGGITKSQVLSAVEALCSYDTGNGAQLYAGGLFADAGGVPATSTIARWNGTAWSSLAGGVSNPTGYAPTVHALLVHDEGSGPRLIVGGRFQFADGMLVNNVARWDGASWSPMGSGLVAPTGAAIPVTALAVYDAGSGPEVYAAGTFGLPDSTWYIARWNGTAWSSVGGGLVGAYGSVDVAALCVADLGGGPKLFVGGRFDGAAGAPSANLLAWDGAWSVPSGVGGLVGKLEALASFDEGAGSGPALFLGGAFTNGIRSIARYDGASLTPLDGGLASTFGYEQPGQALAVFDDHLGAPALYVGGAFQVAGTQQANGMARWRGCGLAGEAFCSGDGSATACPCGNVGANGHGCATSTNPQGARLEGSGVASVTSDSLVLSCAGTSDSVVTYFQGTQQVNGGAGAVFGDGLRCAGGVTLRLGHVLASGGSSHYPNAGDASISVRGGVGELGGRRNYQVWFRNAGSFCTPSTFNLSNGWTIVWTP